MTKKMTVALAATLACALPSLAVAGTTNLDVIVDGRTGAVTRALPVMVSDLNLAKPGDYRRADSRLIRAARDVCGYAPESVMPTKGDYRTCYSAAIEGARSELDAKAQAQHAG
jgi:UrcA family protein